MAYLQQHAGALPRSWTRRGARRGAADRHLDGGLRPGRGDRRDLHGLALRALHAAGDRRQGGIRVADVRQRRADPAGLSTGPVSERGAAAPPDRRLARGRAGHRLHRADIYFPTFVEWTRRHAAAATALRSRRLRSPEASANSLYAFGEHDAIGFSPFAIEAISGPAATLLAASNDVLAQIGPLVARHQGHGTMAACCRSTRQPSAAAGAPERLRPRRDLRARRAGLAGGRRRDRSGRRHGRPDVAAGGLVIATGPDEFIFAGIGVTVTFATVAPGNRQASRASRRAASSTARGRTSGG